MENDKGHDLLVKDLNDLLEKARSFEFHDFKNEKYPAPKMALVEKLDIIRKKVIDGAYDN